MKNEIRVRHFSTSIEGGAGKACYRIHQAVSSQSVESRVLSLIKAPLEPTETKVDFFEYPSKYSTRIMNRIKKTWYDFTVSKKYISKTLGYETFDDERCHLGNLVFQQAGNANIFHIHWVNGFVDFKRLFAYSEKYPIVYTMHDFNTMTGGCHSPGICLGFEKQCGKCYKLNSVREHDLSRKVFCRKARAISQSKLSRVVFVFPSEEARKFGKSASLLKGFRKEVVYNPIDIDIFRQNYDSYPEGYKKDKFKLLFVAGGWGIDAKGYPVLLDAINKIRNKRDVQLITIGSAIFPVPEGIDFLNLGAIGDLQTLAQCYAGADVLVVPSEQETGPQTCVEALACGTPVIGTAVGIMPEVLIEHRTGAILPHRSGEALASVIEMAMIEWDTIKMSKFCRNIAIQYFSYNTVGQQYKRIYASLL